MPAQFDCIVFCFLPGWAFNNGVQVAISFYSFDWSSFFYGLTITNSIGEGDSSIPVGIRRERPAAITVVPDGAFTFGEFQIDDRKGVAIHIGGLGEELLGANAEGSVLKHLAKVDDAGDDRSIVDGSQREALGASRGCPVAIRDGVAEINLAVEVLRSGEGPGAVVVVGEGANGGGEVSDGESVAIDVAVTLQEICCVDGVGDIFCAVYEDGFGPSEFRSVVDRSDG